MNMKPMISIIVPVLNEARRINKTLSHLLHFNFHRGVEVIVVDGDPDGSTINAITTFDVKKTVSPKGRGIQMNKGAAMARGSILLFLHADTTLDPDALNRICHAFTRPGIVGGAFHLQIRSGKGIFRIIETGASIRSRTTRIPYGDQAIFLKRCFFLEIGGYRSIPIMEDVDLMKRVRNAGKRIVFIDSRARTSSRRWKREGVCYCTLRNRMLIMLYHLGVSPGKLARFYRSHHER